jgi:hypothetical protein
LKLPQILQKTLPTLMIFSSSLMLASPLQGTLSIQNKSNCSFFAHTEGFDSKTPLRVLKSDSELTTSFNLTFSGEINSLRQATLPVTISCDYISHIENIRISSQSSGIVFSLEQDLPFVQAHLAISGDSRIDTQNNTVTLMLLPVKILQG